jgi:hypothetical protein
MYKLSGSLYYKAISKYIDVKKAVGEVCIRKRNSSRRKR